MAKLLERTFPEANQPPQVDRDKGIIRGVKILGRESANKRTYSDQALQDAQRLYEGRKVNIDHQRRSDADRQFSDGFGQLEHCCLKGDGVYGDLSYLRSHPLAETVCESAERFPMQFGLSHDAEGELKSVNGKFIVESLSAVRSVDLVGEPATVKGLFESLDGTKPMKKTIKQIVEAVPKTTWGRSTLARLIEEEHMVGEVPVAEVPVEAPAESTNDDQVKAAFRAMVIAAFDDESLDAKATIARIKDILKAQEKLTGTPSEPEPTEPGEETVPESKKAIADLRTEVKQLTEERDAERLETHCRQLLESSKRDISPVRLRSLKALSEDKDRKALIETWPKATNGVARPARSPSVLRESGSQEEYRQAMSICGVKPKS